MKTKLEIKIQSNRQSDKEKFNIEDKRKVQEYILRNI